METSQTIGKISEALAKAQGMMKPAVFDASNPHFKSRYATLTSIMESCRAALSANNIAVVQGTSIDTELPLRVSVTTLLIHSSGEWIKDTLSLRPAKDDAQGAGSAITYARRYSLASLVGVVADEDDDAEAAVGRTDKQAKPGSKKQPLVVVPNSDSPVKASDKSEPKPPVQNGRIAKIKEIFAISAKLGQSPEGMRSSIGRLLGLDHPIRESSEIPDDKIDLIVETFRQEFLARVGNEGEVKAA